MKGLVRGFWTLTELTNQKLMSIDSGVERGVVADSVGIVALGDAIAATAGLAIVPVAAVVGAGTAWEIAVAQH